MEPNSIPSPTEAALQRHGAFVRALARSLVRDASLAEDVAQDTWTRWFLGPPRAENERGWLRAVVRNLATNRLRAGTRRARHEELAARPEALASGADEAEQAELLAKLVAAVLALAPAQRDTLVALYFRGLDAPTLAAESGTPLATVRDRKRRALETLRERLDRDFGGRAAWAVGIGRLAGPPSAPLAPRVATNTAPSAAGAAAKLALAVGAVAAGVVLWSARGPGTEPEPIAGTVTEPAPLAAAANAPLRATASRGEQRERAVQGAPPLGNGRASVRMRAAGRPGARSGAQALGADARVSGRLVFADGTPAAGAELVLSLGGVVSRDGLESDASESESWQDVTALSAADGAFALTFPVPPGFLLDLVARAPGCAEARWSWSELRPGSDEDLGQVELLPAATVAGSVVDADGNPLVGHEWSVTVRSVGLATPSGREELWRRVTCDPATAAFRIEGAMPGANSIEASCPLAGRTATAALTLEPGALAAADVVYTGPDLARRIVLTLKTPRSAQGRKPATAHMRLTDGQTTFAPVALAGMAASYAFDDLAPGAYALEIDDPEFTPWHETGLVPGSVVRAELGGRGSVLLEVLDGETLAPVELFAVHVTTHRPGRLPSRFTAHAGDAPLANGRLAGLFAGDYTIDLVAGDRVGSADVAGLAAGETRALRVLLDRPCALAGSVRAAGGEPHAGLELLLLRPAELEDSDASPVARANMIAMPPERHRHEAGATTTDGAGAFELIAPRPGTYLLAAVSRGDITPLTQPFALARGEQRTGLELALEAPASLALTVRAPEGHSIERMRLLLAPETTSESVELAFPRELGPKGLVELDGLRPGSYQSFLLLPETIQHTTSGWHSGAIYGWSGGQIVNGLALGSLVLESGTHSEHTFTPSHAAWPGTLDLLVRVDGEPAPRMHVDLRGEDPLAHLGLETDAEGRLRAPCFAGSWSVTVTDPRVGGSLAAPDALIVLPAQPTVRTLDLARP